MFYLQRQGVQIRIPLEVMDRLLGPGKAVYHMDLVDDVVHRAMIALQQLKDRSPGLDQMRHIRPGEFEVSSIFGQDRILVLPPVITKIYEHQFEERALPVPVFRQEPPQRRFFMPQRAEPSHTQMAIITSGYMFVPAIAVRSFAGESVHYRPTPKAGHMAVCTTSTWGGVQAVSHDVPYTNVPGENHGDDAWYALLESDVVGLHNPDDLDQGGLLRNVMGFPRTAYQSCTERGDTEWSYDFDSHTKADVYDVGLLYPYPFNGNPDGTNDMGLSYLVAAVGTIYSGFGCGGFYCDETSALSVAHINGTLWDGDGWVNVVGPNSGCHNDGTTEFCVTEDYVHTRFLASARCGQGHLIAEVACISIQDVGYYELSYLPGCWRTYTGCSTNTKNVYRAVIGSAQTKTVKDISAEEYVLTMTDEAGDPIEWIAPFSFDFGSYYHRDTIGTMSAPCSSNQTDSFQSGEVYPYQNGPYLGAYVLDDDPVESIHGNYFVMYIEAHRHSTQQRACSPWAFDDYGYDWSGNYDQGKNGACAPTVEADIEDYVVLAVNLNGVRIVIDVCQDPDDFYVSDSHIYEFFGTPIFMYGYVRYTYVDGKYHSVYSRYGYFYGTEFDEEDNHTDHRQSEIFYPVGVTDSHGRTTPLHIVPGTEDEDEPVYGFGRCAGYIVKVDTSEVVDTTMHFTPVDQEDLEL